MEIIDQFGIQPILLAAQVVNFLILLYLLKRFLYKPVLRMLEQRKKVIEESLKNAAEIEDRLEKTTLLREKRLNEAASEAREIINEATKASGEIVALAHQKAAVEAEKFLENTRKSMVLEKEQLQQEIRSELASLVVLGLQKVTGKVISEKDQKQLIEQSLKGLK